MDYRPDRRGTARMLQGAEMLSLTVDAAETGADVARAAAPVGDGELRDSIHVEPVGTRGGPNNDRAESHIVADAPHAAAVEFGNARVRAQPFLRAAYDAIHEE